MKHMADRHITLMPHLVLRDSFRWSIQPVVSSHKDKSMSQYQIKNIFAVQYRFVYIL